MSEKVVAPYGKLSPNSKELTSNTSRKHRDGRHDRGGDTIMTGRDEPKTRYAFSHAQGPGEAEITAVKTSISTVVRLVSCECFSKGKLRTFKQTFFQRSWSMKF